jgi:uncharacterized protein YuzE
MTTPFRGTHDPEAGASYIYVAGPIPRGGVHRTQRVTDHINLDFDRDGRLIAIELLSDALLHPTTRAVAEAPCGKR